jgi:hypothetical protein
MGQFEPEKCKQRTYLVNNSHDLVLGGLFGLGHLCDGRDDDFLGCLLAQ